MAWYLGPPGRLLTLPPPRVGVDVGQVRAGSERALLSGGTAVDTVGQPKRRFVLSWQQMTTAVFAPLEGLALGLYGPGPFLLVESARANLLPANVSAPTSIRADTFGWGVSAGAVSSVSTPTPLGGRRVISWSPGTTAAGGAVLFAVDAARVASDTAPLITGVTYTAQAQSRLVSGSATTALRLGWYDSTETLLSSTSGSSGALSSGAWTQQTVTAAASSAPAGAVYVAPALDVPAGGAGQVIASDQWQLELAGSAGTWTLGTGVPRVMVDQLTDSYPRTGRHDVTLTLAEV
jgi:hypothetical protein